ncbi:hypothetical protein [Xanthomonas phage BUDD]|nr:hypothetical protein [Xanthomonas phage BUDD]
MATVESRTDKYDLGDVVKDVQIVPYIRSRSVEFYATKMKPNTRVYAFFDGQPVSEFCRDIGFQLSAANAGTASQLVEYGSPLITDANGELRGEFKIPGGRFFTGEKEFVLSDDPGLTGDADMQTTSAKASYFAGGINVTKQNVTLNVVSTIVIPETVNPARAAPEPAPAPPAPDPACLSHQKKYHPTNYREICQCIAGGGTAGACGDPIAQAFIVDNDMFVTSIDLFFKQVDLFSDRVFVQIRDMVNGYPGTTVIAQKYYSPDQIQPFASDDSSKAFKVVFDQPVFLESQTQYCFVVGGYSPNTRLWVSRLGEEVTNMPGKIVEQQTTSEVSFRSLNGSTWNAEQYEQIKYRLYKANFTPGTMNLVFENAHEDEEVVLPENPFQTQTGQSRVRVFLRDHGLTTGDRVSMSLTSDTPFTINVSDFVPQVGQTMHTTTGKGIISDIKSTATANQYEVTLKDISGVFTAGQTYSCDAKTRDVRDWYLISSIDTKKPASYTLNQCFGTVVTNSYGAKYPGGTIAGIPVSEFNTEHVTGSLGHSIVEVCSVDSFIINLTTPATMTGRFGGSGIICYNGGGKFDVFNVSGAYLPYRSSEAWNLTGVGHGDTGGLFEAANYQTQAPISFVPQEDKFLGQPLKIASANNEQIMLGTGGRSVTVSASFNSTDATSTPMVNMDTFSAILISNRSEWQDKSKMTSLPYDASQPVWYAEEEVVNGSEIYKYVTRTVNLENAANDLQLYVDAYKDLNADFDVYFKTLPVYDSGSIEARPWIKANALTKSRSSVDTSDLVEYKVVASEHCTTYTSEGVNYPGWAEDPFTAFKIKLVGRSKNSSKPVLFESLRAIAIT